MPVCPHFGLIHLIRFIYEELMVEPFVQPEFADPILPLHVGLAVAVELLPILDMDTAPVNPC